MDTRSRWRIAPRAGGRDSRIRIPDGRGSILARSPDDLHSVAARIDELMAALSDMEPHLQMALPSTADRAQLNRGEDLDRWA